jgi:hypothetical protein
VHELATLLTSAGHGQSQNGKPLNLDNRYFDNRQAVSGKNFNSQCREQQLQELDLLIP